MKTPRLVALTVLLAVACVPVAHGQLLLSTNDNKVTLVNAAATVVKSPPPDTLTVIDMEYTKRDISAGLRPYGIDIASNGAFAAVATSAVVAATPTRSASSISKQSRHAS